GDTLWFHSLMQLIPEKRVGLFVSYNTDTSAGLREQLFDAFLRRYFPQDDPPRIKPASDSQERLKRLAGEYEMTSHSYTDFTKLAALMSGYKVSVNKDDTLTVSIGERAARYAEVEPSVFRQIDGPRQVVFKEQGEEHVLYLFPTDAPPVSAVKR